VGSEMEQLEQGKQWVIKTVKDGAKELDIEIKLEWGIGAGPQKHYWKAKDRHSRHHLLITYEGKTDDTLFFDEDDLGDCPADTSVQRKLKDQIGKYLRKLGGSDKKIGFTESYD